MTPRDAAGRSLGPFATLSVLLSPDPGTNPLTLNPHVHPGGQRDGQYIIVLEKDSAQPALLATGSVRVFADGVLALQHSYSF